MANVFITGVSSGIGKVTAELLLNNGHRVVGGSRREAKFDHTQGLWVRLDVTDSDSVRHAAKVAIQTLGHVDVVINNAGFTHNAFIEETDLTDAQAVFETNFWGVARINREFLPHFRSRKTGQIIIVGSLAGLMGVIGQGFYSASKHAIEGYAESLAAEVNPFGIAVNVIEPGFHRTNIHHSMKTGRHPIKAYENIRQAVETATSQAVEEGDDPVRVAQAIERLVRTKSFAVHCPVGTDAKWVPRIKRLIPNSLFLAMMRKRFGV